MGGANRVANYGRHPRQCPAKYYLCRPYPAVFIRGYTIKAGRTGRIIPHWTRTKNTFGKGAACRPAPSRLRRLARSTVAGGIPHQRRTRINHFIRRLRTRHERVGTSSRKPCTQNQQAEKSRARTRRPTEQEIADICAALLYRPNEKPKMAVQRVAVAVLFAIETAMRAGEICGLKWADVNMRRRIAHLPITKNGDSRDVPLSLRAAELIEQLRGIDDTWVFSLDAKSLDVLFRRARDNCGIQGLHFHDTRREALTRLSKKVPVEVLAKISGHRDLRILLNVYYRPDMADIAKMLD
ncbi:site-specific integrase [Neisseria gonorrhoeae]